MVLETTFKDFQFPHDQKHWMLAKLSGSYFGRGPSNTAQNQNRYKGKAKAHFRLWFCHWSAKNVDGIRNVQAKLLSCINQGLEIDNTYKPI